MKFIQAKRFSPAKRLKVDLVVIHTAECGETAKADENVANYFAGAQAPMASAHYTVDADSVTQSVLEKDIAWHAGPVNGVSIGIEHAGYAKQTAAEWDDTYSVSMLARSAEIVADICLRYSIPVTRLTAADLKAGKRSGITGHVDVTNGLQAGKGHWDPGPQFPWNEYLDMVRTRVAAARASLDDHRAALASANPELVPVVCDGVTWLVAPIYFAPVGIGEAARIARELGYELPSPALVDAIWRAADLKLPPLPRIHDGSIAQMATDPVYTDQGRLIEEQIAGRSFRLLAGPFKDVVMKDGKVGLYGWHRTDGHPIQPFYAGHASAWKDYSQGLRVCRRA